MAEELTTKEKLKRITVDGNTTEFFSPTEQIKLLEYKARCAAASSRRKGIGVLGVRVRKPKRRRRFGCK